MSAANDFTRVRVGPCDLRVWQRGSGAPLLYLHGFEQHPGAAPYLQALAGTRSVCAPEHPGFGSSSGLEHARDVIDVALMYRRLVEQWGVGQVDVVGHSLGGLFGAELAIVAPHLVRRLVLIDAFGMWLDAQPAPDPFTLLPPALAKAKWHDAANAAKETNAYDAQSGDSPATYRAINMAAATKFLWPLPDRGTRRRLPYLSAPTLVLHGEADGLVPPAYADAWGAAIPGARVVRIAGAGHLPQVEAEAQVLAHVNEFLGE